MAVADVYDALISKRVYKPAFTHEHAVAIISEGSGSHFDPTLVDAFFGLGSEFQAVARNHIEPEPKAEDSTDLRKS